MCKELCENEDFGMQSCQDCGRLICFDVTNGDDLIRPAYVTEDGDLYCDWCGKHNQAQAEANEEVWDEEMYFDEFH